jgi:hypothetical protein
MFGMLGRRCEDSLRPHSHSQLRVHALKEELQMEIDPRCHGEGQGSNSFIHLVENRAI